jgi:hypothetical protein
MHNAAFADHMKRWGQLAGGAAEDASDAAILQPRQEDLIRARAEAWEAKKRQLHHRAAAQQATRDLEAAMARAQEAATRLQHGLQGRLGCTSPQLVAFGLRPRRAAKARARSRALEALAALGGGAAPHHAGEPAIHAAAAPSAGGNAPPAEADAAWTGGDVPQAEADVATLARPAQAGRGEVPQAAAEAAAGGGTAPPDVEAARIEIGEAVPPGRTACVAPAALTLGMGEGYSALSATNRAR